ncbi:MAG: DUF4215 domain-containing protein [Myxococcales bacterium]|nr:DUF4215 domain-containing protein [Myxococcales bacterium]
MDELPQEACVESCENGLVPEVVYFEPRPCVGDVEPCPAAIDSVIRLRFNEPVNPALVGGGMVECGGTLNFSFGDIDPTVGPCLEGEVVVDGVEVTLIPAQPLLYSQVYNVYVSQQIQDLTGFALRQPLTWSFTTQQAPVCGNGELSPDEVCDDGNVLEGDYCAGDCSRVTGACGDGQLQASEEACDDGNETPADGCSVRCAAEFREPRALPGLGQSCGIRRDGTVRCWGMPLGDAPEGFFVDLAVGDDFACAVDAAGMLRCWGTSLLAMEPMATGFVRIEAGGSQLCGIDAAGAARCLNPGGGSPAQPSAATSFASLAVSSQHACGVRRDGGVECWGGSLPAPPADLGSVRQVVTGADFACVLGVDGEIRCWGGAADALGLVMPPEGPFAGVAAAATTICGVREGGWVTCWRSTGGAALMPGGMNYVDIVLSDDHGCGITSDEMANCWGEGGGSALEVPPDFP